MLKSISQYVGNNLTDWTLGTNLFYGYDPGTINVDRIIIKDSGGTPDFYSPDYLEKRIQFLSKAEDYDTSRTNLQTLFDLFVTNRTGITLPVVGTGDTWYANVIEAINAPYDLGIDDKMLFIFINIYILNL